MHDQSAYAKDGAGGLVALDGIPQQRDPQAATLPGLIDGQSAQDRHRDRVGHVALEAAGGVVQRQCARGKAVITHHPSSFGHHIGAGSATDLIGAGAAFQPVVQGVRAAGKPVQQVFRVQQRGRL